MEAPNFSIWSYMSESQRDSVAGRPDCHGPGYCPLPPPSSPKPPLRWRDQTSTQKQPSRKPPSPGTSPVDVPSPPQPDPTSHVVRAGPWQARSTQDPGGGRSAGSTAWHRDLGTPHTGTFHAAGEASPVGEDHQWEMLPVEVPDSLGCFKSRVWKPDLPSLLDDLEKTTSSSSETGIGASQQHCTGRSAARGVKELKEN